LIVLCRSHSRSGFRERLCCGASQCRGITPGGWRFKLMPRPGQPTSGSGERIATGLASRPPDGHLIRRNERHLERQPDRQRDASDYHECAARHRLECAGHAHIVLHCIGCRGLPPVALSSPRLPMIRERHRPQPSGLLRVQAIPCVDQERCFARRLRELLEPQSRASPCTIARQLGRKGHIFGLMTVGRTHFTGLCAFYAPRE
jgi:hypothetical protein